MISDVLFSVVFFGIGALVAQAQHEERCEQGRGSVKTLPRIFADKNLTTDKHGCHGFKELMQSVLSVFIRGRPFL